MRRPLTCLTLVSAGIFATATVAGVFGSGALAAATHTAKGGTLNVWATPGSGAVSTIVITGAIGDYGTATSIDQNGKVDENGNYVKVVLKKGGFEINSVALNKKVNAAPPESDNATTCSFVFGGTGPVTVFDGSGAYAGISGTVQITETFAGIGPRIASGKNKGQCNMSNSAQPIAFYGSITGAGMVSFS